MFDTNNKINHMTQLKEYRESLWTNPRLRYLFLELTMRCNENCIHCGSRCGEIKSDELSLDDYKKFLTKVKADFGTSDKMLCITGGEPLLLNDAPFWAGHSTSTFSNI